MTTGSDHGWPDPARHAVGVRAMLLVALGGAAGALARWAVAETIEVPTGGFPWPTLVVNLVGCVLIGVAARRLVPATAMWLLGVTGAVGGFTTYSTFALEVRTLAADGHPTSALVYVVVTVVGGLVAVEAGRAAAR